MTSNIVQPLLSWILTLALALQTFTLLPKAHAHDAQKVADPIVHANPTNQAQARAWIQAVEPSSIWDVPVVPNNPSELEQTWVAALERTKGKPLSSRVSDSEKAAYFHMWIERLRNNAFSQGSADPNSRYYTSHPLDMWQLLGQSVHVKNEEEILEDLANGKALSELPDVKPHLRILDWKKLTLTILDEEQKPVLQINPEGKDLRKFLPENGELLSGRSFSTADTRGAVPGGLYTMELSAKGEKLHSFKFNITGAAVIGHHLVFLEPSRVMAEEGVVNLSFIDLDYFESAVGKTVLPVFRIPLEVGTDLAKNIENLQIKYTPQGLELGDRKVSPQVLDFFSEYQQMFYNTSVSLTDPQFYKSMAPVVGELVETFGDAMEDQAKGMEEQFTRAGVSFDLLRKWKAAMADEIKLRAAVGAKAPNGPHSALVKAQEHLELQALASLDRVILDNAQDANILDLEHYPTPLAQEQKAAIAMRLKAAKALGERIPENVKGYTERAKKFGEELAQDQAFQDTLQAMNQTMGKQRKLSNRIMAFWSRMTMPQPLGAPKIQQALGLIAASVHAEDTYANDVTDAPALRREAVARLLANGKVRAASLPVLLGAGLALTFPAESGQLMYQGLEAVRASMDGVMGWTSNWGYLVSEAWTHSWAWLQLKAVTSAYWVGDNFSYLTTGLYALGGGLLLAAGGLHTIVNTTHFVKSMVKGGWKTFNKEGKSWLGRAKDKILDLKDNFVGYINGDKKTYYQNLAKAEAKKRGLSLSITGKEDGPSFKGIFKDTALNDHTLLSKAEADGVDLEIVFKAPDGRTFKGVLHSRGTRLNPKYTDADIAARGWMKLEMTLADGSNFSRALEFKEGEAEHLFTDENLEGGIQASIVSDQGERSEMHALLINTNWTPAEKKQLESILASLDKNDGRWAQMMEKLAAVPLIGRFFQKSDGEIRTLGKAFAHFALGYSSWTHSTRLFGKIWNPWFLFRNIAFKPRTWLTMMAYPNYFNRTVFGGKEGHFATYFNGGKRSVLELQLWKRIGALFVGDKEVGDFLKALNEFEKEVVPVEQTLHAAAMRAAFIRFVNRSAEDPDLLGALKQGAIVDPMDARLDSSGDVVALGKKAFGLGSKSDKLDRKMSIYFKAYFTKLYDEAMLEYMRRALGPEAAGLSEKELKELAIKRDIDLTLKDEDAVKLVAEIEAKGEVEQHARETADEFFSGMWERTKQHHLFKVRRSLDPSHNYALDRYRTAEKQMDNPEAMARATRQYLVSLIVDKPMELLFTLLFVAGVDSGIMKPLYDQAFSDNSMFHLSRYVFWNGYFTGIMIALLADVWMKIQMDARLDSQGGFDEPANADDAKKGFLAYYRKSFMAKDNTWWANQKYEIKLSLANMPAYFLTALVTNLAFLGRFDLDAFVTVYKSIFLPLGGLAFKLENAFEKSTAYVLGKVPVKFHVDPQVGEYRNKAVGRLRLKYNIVYKAWENISGNIMGNFYAINTALLGPRGFLRQFYGGYLPTELVVNNVLRPVEKLGGAVGSLAAGCETILTNKHSDAIKILPKGK